MIKQQTYNGIVPKRTDEKGERNMRLEQLKYLIEIAKEAAKVGFDEIQFDYIKSDILAIMGNDEMHVEGAAKATNKTVVSSRFDSSRFKKEYPDLFTEYSRETSYKRFCVL